MSAMEKTKNQRERDIIDAKVRGKTLGDLLLGNARDHGHRPAISWKEGASWRTASWRELRERVLDVACGLASLGIGRGDVVALMAANRPEHIVGIMAVLHTGATPSTFYSTLTPEQIQYVADNCSAKVAILEDRSFMESWLEIRDKLPSLKHVVLIEDADAFPDLEQVLSFSELERRGREARGEFEDRWREVKPEDPATIIYTSGTTGPPKGVILSHYNCLFEVESIDQLASFPEEVSSVSYLPLAHIAEQLLSIYLSLLKVAHLYCCADVKQAVDYVRQARPTFFFGVPRVWEKMQAGITAKINETPSLPRRLLAQAAVNAGKQVVQHQQQDEKIPLLLRLQHMLLERLVLANVRKAIGLDRCTLCASAAAPLPVDVAVFFTALGLPIVEVYGMTETTGVATANRPWKIKIGTVGPPLPGVEVKLADDGEILVRGPICTPGYHKRPEATAELIDDQGWLHTGDVGTLDADGYFSVVDRKKELIITAGGKNISPANVESYLKEHPLVGQALAYGDQKPYVTALVVLDGEVAPSWAKEHDVAYDRFDQLAEHPTVIREIQRAVDQANAHLARVEQVKKFRVLPYEWTADSEELTPTMKLKRRVIHEKYAAEIERLYE
jgi:long-chain acyl-CoA synthetase